MEKVQVAGKEQVTEKEQVTKRLSGELNARKHAQHRAAVLGWSGAVLQIT